MQPWKTISRRVVQEFGKFLTVESHDIELPDGRIVRDWPWLVSPDFVLVLARTTEGKFVCFRQTKYAVKGVTAAPVGGHIEEGEEPLAAAKRELLEETGYAAADWHSLGSYVTHANRGGGAGHLFLALNAHRRCEPHSDDLEEQELVLLGRQELEKLLDGAEFKVLAWSTLIALSLRHLENIVAQPNRKENPMLKTGILNPRINSLISRVRHTNTLVIADRGFPFWPTIETVDIALVDDIPSVLDVIGALRPNFVIGKVWMADEFLKRNNARTRSAFAEALHGIETMHEPHVEFKKRVPQAIGLIRTGDTTQYANVILESA